MMKKLLAFALEAISCTAILMAGNTAEAHAETKLTSSCKSACLMDAYSGQIVYEENALSHVPIASVCKVMTLTLCFDAIENGKLSIDDAITVSEHAAGMGGSQVFLQSGLSYSVGELIKSVVVCSANDSCVALSETISGSEEKFVAEMNKKAAELGCENTLFANCTGLPKATQYSCAKDVAVMFANLIAHNNVYFDYSKIWLEDFEHPDDRITTITNTNKLIKKYSYCDGGKTGFTNEAGFCLAATALKDNMRLVSVVLGSKTSDDRFNSTINLFNYGFANFINKIVLDCNVNLNDKIAVSRGKKEWVAIKPSRYSYVFCSRDEQPEITFNLITQSVAAPLVKGEEVGEIEVYKNGILCDTVAVVCAENVERATFFDNWRKIADKWCL